ncbi:hypothetical protein RvY_02057 [Ramazzottius varieornatus]|uniref:Uncharacterized protein n=1 Tax=Ramazzottius varieornatus TaxID=947166 RepID=A0A1D1UT21_RAMVA|nr:hypothetical protein RvY_02057 [Ramazzottius varieornatus]
MAGDENYGITRAPFGPSKNDKSLRPDSLTNIFPLNCTDIVNGRKMLDRTAKHTNDRNYSMADKCRQEDGDELLMLSSRTATLLSAQPERAEIVVHSSLCRVWSYACRCPYCGAGIGGRGGQRTQRGL